MHTHFRISTQPALSLQASAGSYRCYWKQTQTAKRWRSLPLQDLPEITVNDVGRIIQEACRTSVTKKEKGFKLYVSSYIHNYEGKIWTYKVSMFLY